MNALRTVERENRRRLVVRECCHDARFVLVVPVFPHVGKQCGRDAVVPVPRPFQGRGKTGQQLLKSWRKVEEQCPTMLKEYRPWPAEKGEEMRHQGYRLVRQTARGCLPQGMAMGSEAWVKKRLQEAGM